MLPTNIGFSPPKCPQKHCAQQTINNSFPHTSPPSVGPFRIAESEAETPSVKQNTEQNRQNHSSREQPYMWCIQCLGVVGTRCTTYRFRINVYDAGLVSGVFVLVYKYVGTVRTIYILVVAVSIYTMRILCFVTQMLRSFRCSSLQSAALMLLQNAIARIDTALGAIRKQIACQHPPPPPRGPRWGWIVGSLKSNNRLKRVCC